MEIYKFLEYFVPYFHDRIAGILILQNEQFALAYVLSADYISNQQKRTNNIPKCSMFRCSRDLTNFQPPPSCNLQVDTPNILFLDTLRTLEGGGKYILNEMTVRMHGHSIVVNCFILLHRNKWEITGGL